MNEDDREADVSAEQNRPQAPARLPRADGHHGGSSRPVAPSRQGPQAPFGLSAGSKSSASSTPIVRTLRTRPEFLFVQKGRRVGRPTVTVEARRRAPSGPIGIGFTASKKVGGAVVRNRAKRRLRAAARALLNEYALRGVDYVLVARPETAGAPWPALLDDVRAALLRLAPFFEGAPDDGARRRAPDGRGS
jgi:ribonuclease P protein component